jgi:hypothetical protein
MPTLTNYRSFAAFFASNQSGAEETFANAHENFIRVFDRTMDLGRRDFRSEQIGTAVALLLRSAKYLYVAHVLALAGHTEESRVLLRSVTELEMVGFLVFEEDGVFDLWRQCFESRMANTDVGVVKVTELTQRQYRVNEIVKRYKRSLDENPTTKPLLRRWGEYSTYYSHENLYNVVPRIEQDTRMTEVYIGTSYESQNDRMQTSIQLTVDLMAEVESIVEGIAKT